MILLGSIPVNADLLILETIDLDKSIFSILQASLNALCCISVTLFRFDIDSREHSLKHSGGIMLHPDGQTIFLISALLKADSSTHVTLSIPVTDFTEEALKQPDGMTLHFEGQLISEKLEFENPNASTFSTSSIFFK